LALVARLVIEGTGPGGHWPDALPAALTGMVIRTFVLARHQKQSFPPIVGGLKHVHRLDRDAAHKIASGYAGVVQPPDPAATDDHPRTRLS
jgi:hypothetical protein